MELVLSIYFSSIQHDQEPTLAGEQTLPLVGNRMGHQFLTLSAVL